jgi:ADP-ribose pyrophosphatase
MSVINKWKLLHSEQLVKDHWADVRKNSYQKNDGTVIEPFYVYGFPDYATALAITKKGTVIVERIYRPGLDTITLELPGGCIDPTDTMLESAIERELLEETGYRFDQIEYLGKISPNPTTNTNVMHMFLATGGEEDLTAVRDTEEEVEVLEIEWDDFIADFKAQKFIQSMQTCTILYALMRMNKLIVY